MFTGLPQRRVNGSSGRRPAFPMRRFPRWRSLAGTSQERDGPRADKAKFTSRSHYTHLAERRAYIWTQSGGNPLLRSNAAISFLMSLSMRT